MQRANVLFSSGSFKKEAQRLLLFVWLFLKLYFPCDLCDPVTCDHSIHKEDHSYQASYNKS